MTAATALRPCPVHHRENPPRPSLHLAPRRSHASKSPSRPSLCGPGPDRARPAPLQQSTGSQPNPGPCQPQPSLASQTQRPLTVFGTDRPSPQLSTRPPPQPALSTTDYLQDQLPRLHCETRPTTRLSATLSGDERKPHRPPSRAPHSTQSHLLQKPLTRAPGPFRGQALSGRRCSLKTGHPALGANRRGHQRGPRHTLGSSHAYFA